MTVAPCETMTPMRTVKTLLALIVLAFALVAVGATQATAAQDKVVICHATGAGTYVTLKLPYNAVFGKNDASGHFNEQGTPNAGHEHDYLGPCHPPTTHPTTTHPTTTTTVTTVPTHSTTTQPTTTVPTHSTTSVPDSSTTTTSIVIDTCDDLGTCPSTSVSTTLPSECVGVCGPVDCEGDDCDPADRETTTTTTTTEPCTGDNCPSTTVPTTLANGGTGSNLAISGLATTLILIGMAALRLARRPGLSHGVTH